MTCAAAYGVRAARPAVSARGALLWLLAAAMATGSFVIREPAPFDIAILLLGAAGLMLGAMAFTPTNRVALLALGGYMAVNVASLVMAHDALVARAYLLTTAYLATSFVSFLGFLNAYGVPAWSALLGGYAASGVVATVASALAYWNVLPLRDELLMAGRPKGWFKDPNVFGPYLVVALLYAVTRLQQPGERIRRLAPWAAVLACTAAGVCLSFSRACWINCGVALAAFFGIRLAQVCRTGRASRRFWLAILLTGVLVAGICAALFADAGTRRMLDIRLGHNGLQDYDDVRFYTHERALDAGMRLPLGLGPGQSEGAFGYATHSMYLRVLCENGIPGFLLFYILVLGGLARAAWLALGKDHAIAGLHAFAFACMAGILVNGFVIDVIHWRHFWFVAALTWCSPRGESTAYAHYPHRDARG